MFLLFFISLSSSTVVTAFPSNSTITSPLVIFASLAGELFVTWYTYTPSTKLFLLARASSKSIPYIPIYGLTIFPLDISSLMMSSASLLGIENPNPSTVVSVI